MNTADLIILICFMPALIGGLKKGFIAQAISLVSVLVGAWLAFHFSEIVRDWLAQYLSDLSPTVLYIISFVAVVIVVILLLSIVGKALRGVIRFAMLGWVDRLLGAALGIVTAALVISIVLVLFSYINGLFHMVPDEVLDESNLYMPIKDLAYKVFPYLKALITKQ